MAVSRYLLSSLKFRIVDTIMDHRTGKLKSESTNFDDAKDQSKMYVPRHPVSTKFAQDFRVLISARETCMLSQIRSRTSGTGVTTMQLFIPVMLHWTACCFAAIVLNSTKAVLECKRPVSEPVRYFIPSHFASRDS
jgi:hypothetical protein